MKSLQPLHRFLQSHRVYPLAASTGLCALLIGGRFILSATRTYDFLVWNLILAWLPYLASLWISLTRRSEPGRPWKLLLPAALWLAFLPNAPYIVTDFLHLLRQRPFPIMYDIALIFAFAWTGLLLGLASLRIVQRLVTESAGWLAGASLVAICAMLSGVGVYVGRFLRWNSWDLFTRPRAIGSILADALLNPLSHRHALAHSLVFGGLMLVCYLTVVGLESARSEQSSGRMR